MSKSSLWQYPTIPVDLKVEAEEGQLIIKGRMESKSSFKYKFSDP